jgi:hypothetical protein
MMILFALSRFFSRQLMELADRIFEMETFGPSSASAPVYIMEKMNHVR